MQIWGVRREIEAGILPWTDLPRPDTIIWQINQDDIARSGCPASPLLLLIWAQTVEWHRSDVRLGYRSTVSLAICVLMSTPTR